MHKNSRIYIIISLVVISFIAIIVMFIQNAQNRRSVLKLDVSSEQDSFITYSVKLPLSDKSGREIVFSEDNKKVQGYYEFEINNKNSVGTSFEIFIDMEEYDYLIHPNFVKVYLTDGDNKALAGYTGKSVPTLYKLKSSSASLNGKRVYKGYISSNETQRFILRSWIGDAYSIDSVDKEVKLNVKVEVD